MPCKLTMSAIAPFLSSSRCTDALDTDDETVDPSFDLNSSVRSDNDHLVHKKVIKSHRRISEVQ